jgi:hypothetical protein
MLLFGAWLEYHYLQVRGTEQIAGALVYAQGIHRDAALSR